MSEQRLCTVEGCKYKHFGNGLCKAHYERLRRGISSIDYPVGEVPRLSTYCTVTDGVVICDRLNKTNGLCAMHAQRLRTTGSVGQVEPYRLFSDEKCSKDSCLARVHAKGLCSFHYQRQRKSVDSTKDRLTKYPSDAKCIWEGCGDRPIANKLCHKHYETLRRGSDREYTARESKIINDWKKFLTEAGATFSHGDYRYRKGIPDLICCIDGRFAAIEGKRDVSEWRGWQTGSSERSEDQKKAIDEIRASGGVAICTWRIADVELVVDMISLGYPSNDINAAVDYYQRLASLSLYKRPLKAIQKAITNGTRTNTR